MKAYIVNDDYYDYSEVVFAETPGKARATAQATETFEDTDFIHIRVRRLPQADKYYRPGKWRMDWEEPEDRLALVEECGFYCSYEIDNPDCDTCNAKEFCSRQEDYY